MSIDYERKEYQKYKPRWEMCSDLISHDCIEKYILPLNPTDRSPENRARNEIFQRRAIFAGISGRTARGMLGLVFGEEPILNLPADLEYLNTNASGTGVPLLQQVKDSVLDCLKTGRFGLWVDFPQAPPQGVSRAQMVQGGYFAVIHRITAERIINWRTTQVGAEVIPSLIVFSSIEEVDGEDQYEIEEVDTKIELFLARSVDDQGIQSNTLTYSVRKWQKNDRQEWVVVQEFTPLGGNGKPLNRIPFVFGGSETNNLEVDDPPMYDICKVNVGHLNNSAIFEDGVFIVGQAQPWMSGLDQETIDLLKANNMYIGSGRLLGVPSGERFEFAQVQPNSLAKEAMDDKINLMVGLGALLIQPSTVGKTATQSKSEQRSNNSILSLIAKNVGDAYTRALEYVKIFMNSTGEADLTLNQDYVEDDVNPQTLREMVAGFMGGGITPESFLNWLKRNNLEREDKTLEEFQEELSARAEQMAQEMSAMAPPAEGDDDVDIEDGDSSDA